MGCIFKTLGLICLILAAASGSWAASEYYVNLGDFAKGDGSDETEAIQKAIDTLQPQNYSEHVSSNHPGGVLFIPRPPKFYGISKTIRVVEKWNCVIQCETPVIGTRDMPKNFYFRWIGPDNGTMFQFRSCKGIRVENLSMTGLDHTDLDVGVEKYKMTPIGRHTTGVTGVLIGPETIPSGFLTEAVFDQLYINSVDIGIKLGDCPNNGPDVRTMEFRDSAIFSFAKYGVVAASGNLANTTFTNLETWGADGATNSFCMNGGEVLVLNWTSYCGKPKGADISIGAGGIQIVKAWSEWGGPFLETGVNYPEQTEVTGGSVNYPTIIEGVRHYNGIWQGTKTSTGKNPVPLSVLYNRPVPLHLIGCSLWGGVQLGAESMSTIIDQGTVFIDKNAVGFTGEGITKYGRVLHIGTRNATNGRMLEPYIVDRRNTPGSKPPATGVWQKGDRIVNIDPDLNIPAKAWAGWICVTAGEPGKWAPYGQISKGK